MTTFQRLWPRKLSKKLTLANSIILCVTILGFGWYSASLESEQKIKNDRKQLIVFTKNIAALAAKYLQLHEYDQLETELYRLIKYPGIDAILIASESGPYILSVKMKPDNTVYTDTAPQRPAFPKQGEQLIQSLGQHEFFWQQFGASQQRVGTGWVKVDYNLRGLHIVTTQIFKHSLSLALAAILLSMLVLRRLLARPAKELQRAAEFAEYLDMAQGNQLEVGKSSLEVEQLQRSLNRASQKLRLQEETQRSNALMLESIREIQSQFISEPNVSVVFENLITKMVQMTKSEYGFLGEVLLDENNKPYLHMRALSHPAMNRQMRDFLDSYDFNNLKIYNINNLIGAVIQTKKPVIANDVLSDPRRGGLPQGHPGLDTFVGLPVFSRDRVVAVAGLANRDHGYDQGIVANVQPLLSTCSHMIEGYRNEQNRKQIQDELKRKNANLQTVLDSVSDGIITISQAGVITSVNAAAASIFTRNTNNMVGDYFVDYVAGLENRAGKLYVNGEQLFIQSCNEKVKWRMEGRHKDGHKFPVEISVSEYRHGSEYSFTVTVRNLETDIETFKIKENLISTFDKVLKDSLGSIRGSLVLLKHKVVGELSQSVDDMIHEVYNSTDQLIGLIDSVKDLNRIESGEIELHIRQLDVSSLVDRVLSSNQDVCREYTITFQTAGDLEHTVLADEDRLRQVIRYLVITAARCCAHGGALEFSAIPVNDMLELSVVGYAQQANPEGIAECERLFSDLYNAAGGAQRGTDFSLSLCRAIADHHGGRLGCVAQTDRSVRLFLQIPVYGHIDHVSNM